MTRLSNVGNPSVYEAGDQRTAKRTESEQLHHGRSLSERFIIDPAKSPTLLTVADIEIMKDTGHTSKMAAEHEHKVA